MTKDEALRLALDWFKCYQDKSMSRNNAEELADEISTAIKAALANEALERKAENARELGLDYYVPCCADQTCPKCKAALEAKDEPVAWMYEVNHAHTCLDLFEPPDNAYDEGTLYPLYTTPPQRKPLTDEEIEDVWASCEPDWDDKVNVLTLARAIEAAHGIKGEA